VEAPPCAGFPGCAASVSCRRRTARQEIGFVQLRISRAAADRVDERSGCGGAARSGRRPGHAAVLALAIAAAASAVHAQDDAGAALDDGEPPELIEVKGRRSILEEAYTVTPDRTTPNAADAAELLNLVPGGAVNWNGPITGLVQYRGMFGYRINTRVGDMYLNPGGPNWMDAPLHYAPRPILDHMEIELGIASVSSGAESIGGTVNAVLKSSEFTKGGEFEVHGDVEASGRSVNDAISGGGIVSVANRRHRLHVLGSGEFGGDTKFPDGRIHPTSYERYQVGGGYGLQLGPHRFGLDYRRNDTGEAGTPALPMDIRFVETNIAKGDYRGELGPFELEGHVAWSDVEHEMDNYTLRAPPPPGSMMGRRFTEASGDGLGAELRAEVPLWRGRLTVGGDGHRARHDADIFSPDDSLFFINNFNDVVRTRYGAFAEWEMKLLDIVDLELGVRYTRVDSDAGPVDSLPAQNGTPGDPPTDLRDDFNAADRDRSDDLVDWVVKLSATPIEGLNVHLSGGRKSRAPYYIERYLWLPLQSTAGLADGNRYVGDIGLDPEVGHEVEGGIAWRGSWLYLAPRAFARWVDDYIQGVPATNEDVTVIAPDALQFSNVEALLYGVDLEGGVDLPGPFQLDGTLSYVVGERRDIDDDLFRIAPLRGRVTLGFRWDQWHAALEGVLVARQDRVSDTNRETVTPGYGIMNLYAGWEPLEGLRLVVGIDNVTDALYRDHVSGINRVTDSDVAVGERIPGAGRNFYGRVAWRW
jgi:iron complex outermembrane receptor protein